MLLTEPTMYMYFYYDRLRICISIQRSAINTRLIPLLYNNYLILIVMWCFIILLDENVFF
jgi:hypothetical protein